MEFDIRLAKDAIYWRGLFISRYAAVEFAIAELVSRGSLHHAYRELGHPPFGPAKKLKRFNQMIGLADPIASYRAELQPRLDDFVQYAEHRNFMVHAIMVPASSKDIAFRMYDHREGVYSVGDLHFEMTHLETLATQIRACRQLNGRISFSHFWCVACNFRIRGYSIAQVLNPAERHDSQSAQLVIHRRSA